MILSWTILSSQSLQGTFVSKRHAPWFLGMLTKSFFASARMIIAEHHRPKRRVDHSQFSEKSDKLLLVRGRRRGKITSKICFLCCCYQLSQNFRPSSSFSIHQLHPLYESAPFLSLPALPPSFHRRSISHLSSFGRESSTIKRFITNYKNRNDRFRQCVFIRHQFTFGESLRCNSVSESYCTNYDSTRLMEVAKSTMEVLSSNRRAFNKTWARMSPLINLILFACENDSKTAHTMKCISSESSSSLEPTQMKSLADVGCDHGILTLSLACMARVSEQQRNFYKESENKTSLEFPSTVIGTDKSSLALNACRLFSRHKINTTLSNSFDFITERNKQSIQTMQNMDFSLLPIEFRIGDGLTPLQVGEADAVVLAGMGVPTMMEILHAQNPDPMKDEFLSSSPNSSSLLDKLLTQYLFLQPANSRPRFLISLYKELQKDGQWKLTNETIAYSSGRWYISSFFKRNQSNTLESKSFRFPGHFLERKSVLKDTDGDDMYEAYVEHHIHWLKEDYANRKSNLSEEDDLWVKYLLLNNQYGVKWKNLLSWHDLNS